MHSFINYKEAVSKKSCDKIVEKSLILRKKYMLILFIDCSS